MTWLTSPHTRPVHCTLQQWEWLTSTDSLTGRLRKISNGNTGIKILHADWTDADADEKKLLRLDNQRAWIREITHCYQQEPWVWARVVIPETTLQKTELNAHTPQALGDILFQDPHLKRTDLAVTRLTQHLPYTDQAVWARRSVLWFQQQPLLVKEIFLPDFFHYVENH